MTGWIILSGVTAVAVLAFVLWPLLRGVRHSARLSHRDAVIAALQTERAQLEADHRAGRIDAAAYAAALDELRARILAEAEEDGESATAVRPTTGAQPALAASLFGLALIGGGGFYLLVGAPQWADDARVALVSREARAAPAAGGITPERIRQLVAQLAERLAQNPDDPQGWRMLARSYMVLEDSDAVLDTWAKIGARIPADPEVLLDWGELLAAASGGFTADAVQLVERAVALAPQSLRALALAGAAASASGDPANAIRYWEQLLPMTQGNDEARQAVTAAIAEERQKLAGAPRQNAPGEERSAR
ncbi:c-type cytochrome biogenesis protein CcmI [Hydrogenophilus islandicus]